MQKIIILIVTIVTIFVCYQSAKFCLTKKNDQAKNEAAQNKITSASIYSFETTNQLATSYFDRDCALVFFPMAALNLVWAGIIGLIHLLLKRKSSDPKKKTDAEEQYEENAQQLCHVAIWSFMVIGVILIPTLVNIDIKIAYWIIK